MKQHIIRVAALAAFVAVAGAPASAGELEDGIAAVNQAFAGRWEGTIMRVGDAANPDDAIADSFVSATTSEDGLDYAYWRADALSWAEHTGEGHFRTRVWTDDGSTSVLNGRLTEVEGPDAAGNWSMVEYQIGPSLLGGEQEMRFTYDFADGQLTLLTAMREAGSDEPFKEFYTASYHKTGMR